MYRFGALLAIAVLAGACGARVTDAQRASHVAAGVAAPQAGVPASTGPDVGGPGQAVTALSGGASTTKSTVPVVTGNAPAGDNGGATDIGVTATTVTVG